MDELNKTEGIHLAGEAKFTFPTAGGRVRLSVTEDAHPHFEYPQLGQVMQPSIFCKPN